MIAWKNDELDRAAAARAKLLERRAVLLTLAADARAQGDGVLREREPDPLDVGAGRAAARVFDTLATVDFAHLGEVDDALLRLERGTWGTCLACEDEIDSIRLAIIPEAKFCIECERATEAAARVAGKEPS